MSSTLAAPSSTGSSLGTAGGSSALAAARLGWTALPWRVCDVTSNPRTSTGRKLSSEKIGGAINCLWVCCNSRLHSSKRYSGRLRNTCTGRCVFRQCAPVRRKLATSHEEHHELRFAAAAIRSVALRARSAASEAVVAVVNGPPAVVSAAVASSSRSMRRSPVAIFARRPCSCSIGFP